MKLEFESPEKAEQKRQNTICFLNAAQELIKTVGIKNVSIRKIAEKAGFHNSTIYLYFDDLDQLIMLASVKYFRSYSRALGRQSGQKLTPAENFISVWSLFADSIFQEPHVYYNFFFGKHSDNLQDIMNTYYEIFPEEREQLSAEIESMYFGKNIHDRCMKILEPLANENTRVTKDNLPLLNDLIVSYCKYKLEQKRQNDELDIQTLKEELLDGIRYVIGV